MKHTRNMTAAAVAILLSGTSAFAATLNFQNLSTSWSGAVGGNVVSNNSPQAGTNTASISWGNANGVSGYDFTATSDPVPTPDANLDVPFILGGFTHRNQPITSGTAITSVNLGITGDIFLNSIFQETATFDFGFAHNETPNAGPCPVGEPPCGDIVTVSLLNTTDTFTVGGVVYTMKINGFLDLGGVPNTEFFSPEGGSNSARIQAEFSAAPIPLPAAGWMLLAGIGGLAAMRRRKKA